MRIKRRKNNELEEHTDTLEENQQKYTDNYENSSTDDLDEYNEELIEDNYDLENDNRRKIVPPEYNDQEFDSLSKTEQNKIVQYNIIAVGLFFVFFLIILSIIL